MGDVVVNVDNLKLTVKSYPHTIDIVLTIPTPEKGSQLRPEVGDILTMTADATGISVDRILGPSKEAEVVKARDKVAWLLWNEQYMSTTEIGRILNRDHSSIVASLRRSRAAAESSGPPE